MHLQQAQKKQRAEAEDAARSSYQLTRGVRQNSAKLTKKMLGGRDGYSSFGCSSCMVYAPVGLPKFCFLLSPLLAAATALLCCCY